MSEALLAVGGKPEISVLSLFHSTYTLDQELDAYSFVVEGGNHCLILYYIELHISESDFGFSTEGCHKA